MIRLQTALLALAGCLALILAFELFAPMQDITVPVMSSGLAGPAMPPLPASDGSQQWQAVILARPLFRPDRRPLPAVASAAASTPMPRLTAIVTTAAGASAIFAGDEGKPVIVTVGGIVDGATVRSISPDRVVLLGASGQIVLRPQYAAPGAPASADDAPPPPHHFLDNE